jgi:hypothetical protein
VSLLSICTDVAAELALAIPTFIVNNPDETAIRLLAAAQLAGKFVSKKPQGGWVSTIREYDFTTNAILEQAGTIANVGGFGVISGLTLGTSPIAAGTWYAFGTGVPNNAIITAVTVNDPHSTVTFNQAATTTGSGEFNFGQSDYALPSDFQRAIDNTMWDRSRYWIMRGPQSPQQWQLYKSSVIGRASIQRRYRFRTTGGNQVFSIDPVPTDNDSPLVFEYVSNAWCESDTGTPQTQWMADTDTGIVDEYLLMLCTRYLYLRRLGLSYSEELNQYETEIRKAMAVDGACAILSLVPQVNSLMLIGPFNVQESNFPGGA